MAGAAQIGSALSPLVVVPLQAPFGWRVPFAWLPSIGAQPAEVFEKAIGKR
jgi:hypothetical protein